MPYTPLLNRPTLLHAYAIHVSHSECLNLLPPKLAPYHHRQKTILSRLRRSSVLCRISPNPSEPLIYVMNLPFLLKMLVPCALPDRFSSLLPRFVRRLPGKQRAGHQCLERLLVLLAGDRDIQHRRRICGLTKIRPRSQGRKRCRIHCHFLGGFGITRDIIGAAQHLAPGVWQPPTPQWTALYNTKCTSAAVDFRIDVYTLSSCRLRAWP